MLVAYIGRPGINQSRFCTNNSKLHEQLLSAAMNNGYSFRNIFEERGNYSDPRNYMLLRNLMSDVHLDIRLSRCHGWTIVR